MFNIFRQIYLNSFFYEKKISKIKNKNLEYKPSTYLLSSIIKLQTKKFNIEDFTMDSFWVNDKLNERYLTNQVSQNPFFVNKLL